MVPGVTKAQLELDAGTYAEAGMGKRDRDDGSESGYGGCFLFIWILTYPVGAFGALVTVGVATSAEPLRRGVRSGLIGQQLQALVQSINGGQVNVTEVWLVLIAMVGVALLFLLFLDLVIRFTGRAMDTVQSVRPRPLGDATSLVVWMIAVSAGFWVPFTVMMFVVGVVPL